jgi:hypothetical protein
VKGSALLLVEPYVTRAPEAGDYVYLLKRGFGFAGEPSERDAEALAVTASANSAAHLTGVRQTVQNGRRDKYRNIVMQMVRA